MKSVRAELVRAIADLTAADGLHVSPVPGVHYVRYSRTDRRTKRQWRACLGIVAQGAKEVVLGHEVFRCEAGHYTAAPIHLPVVSRIAAAEPDAPFLGLLIDLDPLVAGEVAAQLDDADSGESAAPVRALFSGVADERMLEATLRLVRVLRRREEARVIGPLAIREIFYYLLKGPDGAAIRQFVRAGTAMHKVSQAVFTLRSSLEDDVDIPALARAAGMSRSAFFKHFKDVTAMSPIQYQKRLRLLEARRLMVDEAETAERSSFRVGYKSASQFSREYSRMFGQSPVRDALKIRKTGGITHHA